MKIELKRYPTHNRPMLVRYWQPWREMETLRRQLDQVFDELPRFDRPQTALQTTWTPAVELEDAGNHFVLRAQLPGIEAKDLDIQVSKKAVAIRGEHRQEQKSEENGFFRSEFRYGNFQRIVPLPVAIQNDQVQAEYKDGVLHLTLPKVTEAQNSVVKINLAEQTQPSETAQPEATQEPVA
jgi:HSP20 family protein